PMIVSGDGPGAVTPAPRRRRVVLTSVLAAVLVVGLIVGIQALLPSLRSHDAANTSPSSSAPTSTPPTSPATTGSPTTTPTTTRPTTSGPTRTATTPATQTQPSVAERNATLFQSAGYTGFASSWMPLLGECTKLSDSYVASQGFPGLMSQISCNVNKPANAP